MGKITQLTDIEIYKEALLLSRDVYVLCKSPILRSEYSLSDQVKRASVSVAANIAEGYGRGTKADFARFLAIALGSTNEVVALIDLMKLSFTKLETTDIRQRYIVLSKRIYAFKRKLNS